VQQGFDGTAVVMKHGDGLALFAALVLLALISADARLVKAQQGRLTLHLAADHAVCLYRRHAMQARRAALCLCMQLLSSSVHESARPITNQLCIAICPVCTVQELRMTEHVRNTWVPAVDTSKSKPAQASFSQRQYLHVLRL
jgi:hypothetical protein